MDTAKYAYQALLFISQNGPNASTVVSQALAVMARLSNVGGHPTAVESNELINAVGGVKPVPANAGVPHKVPATVKTEPVAKTTAKVAPADAELGTGTPRPPVDEDAGLNETAPVVKKVV